MKISKNPDKEIKRNCYGDIIKDTRKDVTVDEIINIVKNGEYVKYYGGNTCVRCYISSYPKCTKYPGLYDYDNILFLDGTEQEHKDLEMELMSLGLDVKPKLFEPIGFI